ncbi:MAG: DUF4097 family beta strand repeat protein [Candidatus Aminicenantes bacterium]|nr:DUF4097 family beta strand repeat protein [Candidatus Aminicenantes bacterium]
MRLKKATSLLAVTALLALAAVSAGASLGDREGKAKYEEKFQKTENLAADGRVYLANISGEVKVLTWSKNEVFIDALKISKAASVEKAKENAGQVKIEANRTNGRLEIRTRYPEGRNVFKDSNVSVNYVLTVPAGAEVEVKNVSGDVRAENLGGRAKLETVSGDIAASKMRRGGTFVAVSGDIVLADIAGDFKAKTVSGDIEVSKAAGSVGAKTVSGDVKLRGLAASKTVEVNVLSGDVLFEGTLNPDGAYNFESHSGDVTLVLPENAAFDFSCKTFSGDITSDFKAIVELQGKIKSDRQDISGEVNGGGADVTCKTFSGEIRLKKK